MEQDNFEEQREEPKKKNKNPFNALIPRKDYFFTPILLNINLLLFILMVIKGASPVTPTSEELRSWGANYRPDTMNGEPWRLFTSMFLHFGIIHLAVNMYSLYSLGDLLEKFIGKWRFIALYLFTGLCGSAASLWWHNAGVSAGASGAIFGLFGIFAATVTTNLIDPNSRKQLLRGVGLTILINAAIGLWSGIDNSAHLGGFLSGILGGYLIFFDLKAFYQQRKTRYVGLIAGLVLMIGVIVFFWMNTPKTIVAQGPNLDVLFARYDSERIKAFQFVDEMDSTTVTLEDVQLNMTKRWEHCVSLLDSMKSQGLSSEGKKYIDEVRLSTLWGLEASKYYERSFRENRKDFIDSGKVLLNKHNFTFEAVNKALENKKK